MASLIERVIASVQGVGALNTLNPGIANKTSIVSAINSVYSTAASACIGFKFLCVENKNSIVSASVGDQIHVTDDGDGKWAVYRVTSSMNNASITTSIGSVEKLMDADASSSEIAAVIEKWARLDENEFEILSSKAYSNYLQYFSAHKNYLNFYFEILSP